VTQQRIGALAGIARPTRRVSALLALSGNDLRAAKSLHDAMDGVEAIDALSRLLTEAMNAKITTDGRVDMRDVAAYVLGEMKRHPR
jgi:hypothetical protein